MIVTTSAKRYSRALFELAKEKKCLDEILYEFNQFIKLVESNKNLQLILKLPNVTRRMPLLLVNLRKSYSRLFFNFLILILQNNRYFLLKQMLEDFQIRFDKFNKRTRALVITAIPLTDKVSFELVRELKSYFQMEILIENKVEPEILGGIIININGRVFNASILEKFKKMKLYLTKN